MDLTVDQWHDLVRAQYPAAQYPGSCYVRITTHAGKSERWYDAAILADDRLSNDPDSRGWASASDRSSGECLRRLSRDVARAVREGEAAVAAEAAA